MGNGNGTFQAPQAITLSSSVQIQSMIAGQFVTGGLPDLAVTLLPVGGAGPSKIQLLLNHGKGVFTQGQSVSVGQTSEGLAAADFNGDGKLDLVTTQFLPSGLRNVVTLLGNGDGTFGKPILTPTGFSPYFVSTGDFSHNGKPSLVLVDYFQGDESVLVMPGKGDGTFAKPTVFKFPDQLGFTAPVVGDFFGDGKLSFAVPSGLGQITMFHGNGDGSFQAPVNYLTDFTGEQPSGLVAADFNGDGKLDLASASANDGTVSVLLNNSPPPATGTNATSVALAASTGTSVFGQPVTLTATVKATSGIATGSVLFFDGSTFLGEVALDPNGQARLLVELAPGTHSLKAVFKGIAPFGNSTSATVSETVNKAATTTSLSVNTRTFGIMNFVGLTATIAPVAPGSGSPTGTVTFMEGSTVLGTATVSGGQASLVLENTLPPGQHTVTAIYSGDGDFLGSTSPAVTFTVS
jgi:hypothetical protein